MKKSETYSQFLKAETLETTPGHYRTMVLTIKDIRSHEFEDGKKQRVISFHEEAQELGLNVTNWDSIAEITGKADDDDWSGEKIELFVDPKVKFGTRTIPAIRIRKVGSNGTGNGSAFKYAPTKLGAWTAWQDAAKPAQVDTVRWKGVVARVAAGRTVEQLTEADWAKITDEAVHIPDDVTITVDDIPI